MRTSNLMVNRYHRLGATKILGALQLCYPLWRPYFNIFLKSPTSQFRGKSVHSSNVTDKTVLENAISNLKMVQRISNSSNLYPAAERLLQIGIKIDDCRWILSILWRSLLPIDILPSQKRNQDQQNLCNSMETLEKILECKCKLTQQRCVGRYNYNQRNINIILASFHSIRYY